MKKLIIPIGYLLMGIFFARCDFLEGIYPLGIALLTIFYLSENFFYIFSGAIIGALTISFEPKEMLINSLSYFLLLPMVLFLRNKKVERLAFSMLLGFLVFLIPATSLRIDVYSRIVLVFSGLFSMLMGA